MWEPVGPLPAAVYWRRRWVALGSAVVLVALIVLSVVALAAPRDDGATVRAARTALTGPATPALPVTPPVTSPVTPPTTTAAPPSSTVPATTSTPAPPAAPVPCTNAMLAVGAGIDTPVHKVGDHPLLRLVVTNTTDRPCVRDLDPARQEIVVWNGNQRTKLWSSNDCANASRADVRTLAPRQPVVFALAWLGRTSDPGCTKPRKILPAGAYRVLTRLDDDISPPTPFLLS